jgi:hypothetical protein
VISSLQGFRLVPLASASRPALGSTQPPVQWVLGVLSAGLRRGWGVTLTTHPHLVTRCRLNRSYTSSPPKLFHCRWWDRISFLAFYPTMIFFMNIPSLSVCYKSSSPPYFSLCDQFYNILWRLHPNYKATNYTVFHSLLHSISLRSQYSSQHHVLKFRHSVFVPLGETPSFTSTARMSALFRTGVFCIGADRLSVQVAIQTVHGYSVTPTVAVLFLKT